MVSKKESYSGLDSAPIESLNYEAALDQLEEIINKLEFGEQTLDESLDLYEKGQLLARRCTYLLEQAEMKIKILAGEDLVDFEPEK
jgi:exodeoxyribonuclease VII small subunit